MHFHAYIPSILYIVIYCCWCFSNCHTLYFSLSLSLSLTHTHVRISLLLWHLNTNLLHPRTLCILGHLLPLILHLLPFGSMMKGPIRTSQKTFLDKAFIRNAKSSYRIFLMLTYPLSSTVGVGSGMAPRSPVPP